MKEPRERISQYMVIALRLSLLTVCALFILVFLWLSIAKRLPYPFELEWMEGGSVTHVQRVLRGEPLYVPPSLEFVPYAYTPLYFYVSALLSNFTGLGLFPLRLISLLSIIGAAFLIFQIVRTRTQGSTFWGFVAASFLIASFRVTGAWFDIARVDSLFLFLLLSSIIAFRARAPLLHSGLSPVLIFLAFFTKQTALFIALPLALWSIVFRRGYSRLLFVVIFFSAFFLSTIALDYSSNGWYSFYVFFLPSKHAMVKSVLVGFWSNDLFRYAGIACAFSAFFLFNGYLCQKWREWFLDAILLGSMILASYFSRLSIGGSENVLFPAYAVLALYFSLGMSLLVRLGKGKNLVKGSVYLAALIQFLCLFYWPNKQIPTRAAEAQGRKIMEVLSSTQGEIYMPSHPWYQAMLGKSIYGQAMAIWDVQRGSEEKEARERLEITILKAISEKRFGAIILDREDEFPHGTTALIENYILVNSELTDATFTPITGSAFRPRFLYLPKGTTGTSFFH